MNRSHTCRASAGSVGLEGLDQPSGRRVPKSPALIGVHGAATGFPTLVRAEVAIGRHVSNRALILDGVARRPDRRRHGLPRAIRRFSGKHAQVQGEQRRPHIGLFADLGRRQQPAVPFGGIGEYRHEVGGDVLGRLRVLSRLLEPFRPPCTDRPIAGPHDSATGWQTTLTPANGRNPGSRSQQRDVPCSSPRRQSWDRKPANETLAPGGRAGCGPPIDSSRNLASPVSRQSA